MRRGFTDITGLGMDGPLSLPPCLRLLHSHPSATHPSSSAGLPFETQSGIPRCWQWQRRRRQQGRTHRYLRRIGMEVVCPNARAASPRRRHAETECLRRPQRGLPAPNTPLLGCLLGTTPLRRQDGGTRECSCLGLLGRPPQPAPRVAMSGEGAGGAVTLPMARPREFASAVGRLA